jgi:hypothetical protein
LIGWREWYPDAAGAKFAKAGLLESNDGSSFDCSLFLGIPVDREFVQEMKNGSDGLACNDIMTQVCILVVCHCDGLTQRFRCILRDSLTCISIDGLASIILGYLYVREIRFIGEMRSSAKQNLDRYPTMHFTHSRCR